MKEMFLQNGFTDFLSKPIDIVKLNSMLEQWLPKSKQKSSGDSSTAQESDRSSEMLLEIAGVDIKKGIKLSGGNTRMYYETLAIYHDDGEERISKLRECLDTGDITLFSIHVHALKSASANIGAGDISAAARALEIAGQRGDVDYLEANADKFIASLERLLSDITSALQTLGKSGDQSCYSRETEEFRAELLSLKAALADVDAGVINRSIDKLMESTHVADAKAIISNILKHILLAEYEKADALIDTLLSFY
jgi:HPt (histidine-containing phosphotransfer) domain-containing protein